LNYSLGEILCSCIRVDECNQQFCRQSGIDKLLARSRLVTAEDIRLVQYSHSPAIAEKLRNRIRTPKGKCIHRMLVPPASIVRFQLERPIREQTKSVKKDTPSSLPEEVCRWQPAKNRITEFRYRYGQFLYSVLSFEVCNKPDVQKYMNYVFRDILEEIFIIYLVGTETYSNSLAEHKDISEWSWNV